MTTVPQDKRNSVEGEDDIECQDDNNDEHNDDDVEGEGGGEDEVDIDFEIDIEDNKTEDKGIDIEIDKESGELGPEFQLTSPILDIDPISFSLAQGSKLWKKLRKNYNLILGHFEQPIECKAAILWKEGQPMTIEKIVVDPPREGEVRVRLISAGICATDGHFVWGEDTDLTLPLNDHPLVLGHEGAGVVESVGEGVTGVSVGDHVLSLFMPNCEKCSLCTDNPKTNMCLSDNFITTLYHKDGNARMHCRGKPLLSLCGISSFSEYTIIRETQLVKIPREANLIDACLISCAVGTGFGSVNNIAKMHPGSTAAIWGLGAVGLSVVMACKEAKAKRIIGIDINPDKYLVATKLGCTEVYNPNHCSETPLKEVFKTEGGIDYAFDCIGNEEVLNTALDLLTPWGTLTSVGLPPRGIKLKVPTLSFLTGTRISGGLFGGQKSRKAVLDLMDRYIRGDIRVDLLISHRFKLEQINEAFDMMKNGKLIRGIIEYY